MIQRKRVKKEGYLKPSPMSYSSATAGIYLIKILEYLESLPHMKPTTLHFLIPVNKIIQTNPCDDLFLFVMGISLFPVSSTTFTNLQVVLPKERNKYN